MNPVVHFEMPYDDSARMADFYKKAFGWQMNILGAEMGNYVVAWTAETDPATRMVKNSGQINGGFFKKTPDNTAPSVVIAVKNIEEAMKNVTAAGGKINFLEGGKPVEIPGIGLYVGFLDSEGNRVSLLQPRE
jgi:predicted enzyme related to lactoylglutathione lyase